MKPALAPQFGDRIEEAILAFRGQKVMLDRDLAALYGVSTGNLNKAVRRNPDRFPPDFMFQLTSAEAQSLIFHFGRSKGRGGRRHPPHVFTEQGVAMLSGVLRTKRAVSVNVAIMRAFVRLRQALALHKDLAGKLTELERKLEGHDGHIRALFDAIRRLTAPAPPPSKPQIGFHVKEDAVPYRVRPKGAVSS